MRKAASLLAAHSRRACNGAGQEVLCCWLPAAAPCSGSLAHQAQAPMFRVLRTAAAWPPEQLRQQREAPPAAAALAAAAPARGFSAEAANSTLAPCERPPVEQNANELDGALAAAVGQGPAAVLALVETQGERFTEHNVITALKAVAEACATDPGCSMEDVVRNEWFQALVDMLLAGMQRFPPALLAEAVGACGEAGASEEMLLDEIGREIMKHIPKLGPADIANLVTGYAALQHSPGVVLFDSLAAAAKTQRAEFTAEQRAAIAAAYEALGYEGKSPFEQGRLPC
ncbi:hypothetical protein ABPG75_008074 [Micractinium tetrahymenae]